MIIIVAIVKCISCVCSVYRREGEAGGVERHRYGKGPVTKKVLYC